MKKVYQRDPRIKRGLRSHGLLLVKLDFCLENMSTTLRMRKSFNFSNRLEMQCQFARKGYLREPLTHFQQKCDEMQQLAKLLANTSHSRLLESVFLKYATCQFLGAKSRIRSAKAQMRDFSQILSISMVKIKPKTGKIEFDFAD